MIRCFLFWNHNIIMNPNQKNCKEPGEGADLSRKGFSCAFSD